MAFEATKKEWCELYSFFRLLADGKVVLGTAEAKAGDTFWPVAMIQREEHDGTRQYYIEEDTIRIEGENGSKSMPREDFGYTHSQSLHRRRIGNTEIEFIERFRSSDYHPVIPKEQTAHRRNQTNGIDKLFIITFHTTRRLIN